MLDDPGIDGKWLKLGFVSQGIEQAHDALESQFNEANADLVKDAPLPEMLALIRRFVEGKLVGIGLARRIGRETEGE